MLAYKNKWLGQILINPVTSTSKGIFHLFHDAHLELIPHTGLIIDQPATQITSTCLPINKKHNEPSHL